MMNEIYLDYAATTPVDHRVAQKMIPYLTEIFGNPASNHAFGQKAKDAIHFAREEIASLIQAPTQTIVFTSGATESDNLAIMGYAKANCEKGRHLITVKTEHKAVLDPFAKLEKEGFRVTYLTPQENGLISMDELKNAITAETILISVMWVNNEIGVIQPIEKIAQLCKAKKIAFHSDAAQAAGKVTIDVSQVPIDLLTLASHKVYGPKGIGALYIRRGIRLAPQMLGGGHENGMRSGTLATHQIVGMGEAFRLAKEEMSEELKRIQTLSTYFKRALLSIKGAHFNGDEKKRVPHNLNVSFAGIEGEALMASLKGLCVSSGSACTAASIEPSHVLCAIGHSAQLAHASLRLTIGRFTTDAEIDQAIQIISNAVKRLRELSPLCD